MRLVLKLRGGPPDIYRRDDDGLVTDFSFAATTNGTWQRRASRAGPGSLLHRRSLWAPAGREAPQGAQAPHSGRSAHRL